MTQGATDKSQEQEPTGELARLHVFDGSPVELRGRRSQLRMAGLERSWEISGHSSRNALLDALKAETKPGATRQSVVLIDARVESGDIDQVGFRICGTIKRHERLWRVTRPLIWVDRLTEANSLHAQQSGAIAIVDDDWVDRTDAAGLGEELSWAMSQTPRPYGRGEKDTFRILSDQGVDPEAEAVERNELFKRRFGRKARDLDFILLWGMAGAVELSFLWWYCEHADICTRNTAKKGCERLQAAMRPDREHLDRPEPSNAEIARRFLAEVAPAAPDPLAELAWPGIEYIQGIFRNLDLRKLAYLEPGSESLLESFFASYEPAGPSARERYEAIIAACANAAANAGVGEQRARRQIQRSLHALDDARLDHLAPGTSSA